MRIIGLTGGIGAGKSTVARLLADLGAQVIDVDALGRSVLAPGGSAETGVIARFGPGVVGADGHVDRAALAAVVFGDPAELRALEDISHPAINREIDRLLDAAPDESVVVLDMAILYGSRLGRELPSGRGYEQVLVVEASEATRIERLVHQRGMSADDARARIASQPSDDDRRSIADLVITNDGEVDQLGLLVEVIAPELGL